MRFYERANATTLIYRQADFMISSPLMNEEYNRLLPEYNANRNRPRMENGSE